MRESAPFHFTTTWRSDADAATVWATFIDVDRWPQWWPEISSAQLLDARTSSAPAVVGPGSRARLEIRSALGFTLRFGIEVQVEDPPHAMMFTASGDLNGVGHWSLVEDGPVTTVSILWCVTTTRSLIRLLRPLAPSTHALAMRSGNSGLNKWLSQRAW